MVYNSADGSSVPKMQNIRSIHLFRVNDQNQQTTIYQYPDPNDIVKTENEEKNTGADRINFTEVFRKLLKAMLDDLLASHPDSYDVIYGCFKRTGKSGTNRQVINLKTILDYKNNPSENWDFSPDRFSLKNLKIFSDDSEIDPKTAIEYLYNPNKNNEQNDNGNKTDFIILGGGEKPEDFLWIYTGISSGTRIEDLKQWLEQINKIPGLEDKLYFSVTGEEGGTRSYNKANRMDDFSKHLEELIRNGKHQIILTGAPGAGKTYTAKQLALHLIDPAEDDQTDLSEGDLESDDLSLGSNLLHNLVNAADKTIDALCWKKLGCDPIEDDTVFNKRKELENELNTLKDDLDNVKKKIAYTTIFENYNDKYGLELKDKPIDYSKKTQTNKTAILNKAKEELSDKINERISAATEEFQRVDNACKLINAFSDNQNKLNKAISFLSALIDEVLNDDSFVADRMIYLKNLLARDNVRKLGKYEDDGDAYLKEVISWLGLYAQRESGQSNYDENALGRDLDDLRGRIKLVQFHPSYDYTDFVEGIRPVEVKNNDNKTEMEFHRMDGSFMRFCRYVQWKNKRDGREDRRYFFLIDEINRADIAKVFGELMYGLEEDKRGQPITTQYSNLETYFKEKTEDTKNDDYFICFESGFRIPSNVVVIGTMNEIDRSVESMDFAMRRRFIWEKVEVTYTLIKQAFENGSFFEKLFEDEEDANTEETQQVVNALVAGGVIAFNKAVLSDGGEYGLRSDYDIAHGQFVGLKKEDLVALDNTNDPRNKVSQRMHGTFTVDDPFSVAEHIMEWVWLYKVEPLMREYLRGNKSNQQMGELQKQWRAQIPISEKADYLTLLKTYMKKNQYSDNEEELVTVANYIYDNFNSKEQQPTITCDMLKNEQLKKALLNAAKSKANKDEKEKEKVVSALKELRPSEEKVAGR